MQEKFNMGGSVRRERYWKKEKCVQEEKKSMLESENVVF
jgi:hypothetical protein